MKIGVRLRMAGSQGLTTHEPKSSRFRSGRPLPRAFPEAKEKTVLSLCNIIFSGRIPHPHDAVPAIVLQHQGSDQATSRSSAKAETPGLMVRRRTTVRRASKRRVNPLTMGLEEAVLAMFTLCNGARVFAYLPQMRLIRRDRNGAAAVSCTTWGVFGASHLSTAAYALVISHDWHMVLAFGVNAAGSFLIIALAVRQKHRLRQEMAHAPGHMPVSPAQAGGRPGVTNCELLSYFGATRGRSRLTPSN